MRAWNIRVHAMGIGIKRIKAHHTMGESPSANEYTVDMSLAGRLVRMSRRHRRRRFEKNAPADPELRRHLRTTKFAVADD